MSENDLINSRRDDAYVSKVLAAGSFARTTAPDDVAARARLTGAVMSAAPDGASSPPHVAVAPALRPITALDDLAAASRNPIAAPPKIAWIPVERLMIDEGYQRGIGKRGRANILRLVQGWDWNCYKPLSVAPAEGRDGWYEVVDGQHSAIAAATHGSIELLPCVVLAASSRAEKAAAFLGINRDRVTLTAFALFRARLASGEALAGAVDAAMDQAGVGLVESLQSIPTLGRDRPNTAAIGTLSLLARRGGGDWLAWLLSIAVRGEATVITAGLLGGLAAVVEREDAPPPDRISAAIKAKGWEALGEAAMAAGRRGDRAGRTATDAWVTVILEAVAALDSST